MEVCLALQLLYDMYTDHRMKALVARYKGLYVEHVEAKLWAKPGMQLYEESMPFDKLDAEKELPLLRKEALPRTRHGPCCLCWRVL